ncbi:unnamed protein product [Amoebophrya sp. A25]|nr:unnamed protein product [Amoebophrya sp. A25]|eukprot:GSA25T00006321001.1
MIDNHSGCYLSANQSKTVSLVDSCANKYLSSHRSDFKKISHRLCHISGTAGKRSGNLGRLKENKLGLKYGVHFEHLPKAIDRIIPWLGEGNCHEKGWQMNFTESGGTLYNTRSGRSLPITNCPQMQLPILGCDMFSKEENETEEDIVCTSIEEARLHSQASRLDIHRRLGHFHVDGLSVSCPECDRTKGQRRSHAKVRPPGHIPSPLKTLAIDFAVGIRPVSIRSKRCALVIICDSIKMCFVRPLCLKSDCVEVIEEVIKGIRQDYSLSLDDKVVWFIRRDNEPVLSSDHMTKVMQSLLVSEIPGVPYNPEMNGTCERFMRTIFGAVRTMLVKVDRRLWCYCLQYAGDCWNRLPHRYAKMPERDGMSPVEILEKRIGKKSSKSGLGMLRRFGCLVYFREQVVDTTNKKEAKLASPYRRGVFLGLCPVSSGWLVGTYHNDGRTKAGFKWSEYSTLDVKFRESILVKNIDWLLPTSKGIYVDYDPLENLQSGTPSLGPVLHRHALQRMACQPRFSGTEYSSGDPTGMEMILDNNDIGEFFCESLDKEEDPKTGDDSNSDAQRVEEGNISSERVSPDSNPEARDPRTLPIPPSQPGKVEEGKKGRGRPKGSKDKNPGQRKRRTKAELEALRKDMHKFAMLAGGHELEEGETFLEAHVMLSVSQALKSPDAEKWRAAITKEEARLLAFETWAPATDEELRTSSQVMPIAIVLTVKRDGTFKARACVLGNLDRSGNIDTYAPVVSHAANRLLLVSAATDSDFVIPFDLDSAFLNAELDRDVFCRLPPVWAEKHGADIVKLKKALYGLKDAPRAWFKKYCVLLSELGWEPCPSAPGLWRKKSKTHPGKYMKMSVYVDDNLATGPDYHELRSELDRIFSRAPGRPIEMAKRVDSLTGFEWLEFDFLGAIVHYCREARSVKILMNVYIEKTIQKYKITLGKPVWSPNFDESALLEEGLKLAAGFPLREIVGALLWISTTARPDICVPVATLARYVSKPVTERIAKACRKVLKYLATTKDQGLYYSPESEEEFNGIYKKLLPEGRELPYTNWFSDAGFANCIKSMRSTSGSIMYYRGFPICWKRNTQTVRAYSTAESEYIAASDTIVMSELHDFTDFFNPLPTQLVETRFGISPSLDDAILWIDNQSAISTAKSEDTKPKSRHYALRYLRVRDAAEKVVFCPTHLMKADGLTKLSCSSTQRRLLLHHIENPVISRNHDEDDSDSETEDDESGSSSASVAVLTYSIFLGC